MKSFIFLMIVASVFGSCSSTALISLKVLEPAPVTIPSYIKNIAVVNRSLPSGTGRVADVVDKIFSLEGAELDKDGSMASIRGLEDELSKDKRFVAVRSIENTGTGTTAPQLFPAPLSWDEVERICRENDADALFSLELFDTDSKISYSATPVKVNTILGNIPAINQQASILTNIKTGWRIYDPAGRNILDEFAVSRNIRYSGGGINPVKAANALIGRKEAVMEAGNKAGQAYAYRIVPFWLTVGRDYFIRGSSRFKVARRKVQTGNWNDAGDIWQAETKNTSGKIAGRACYNLAIVSEVNGDLDQAIQWAQKSYEDYNNRLALKYVRILEDRKKSNARLNEQDPEPVSEISHTEASKP